MLLKAQIDLGKYNGNNNVKQSDRNLPSFCIIEKGRTTV